MYTSKEQIVFSSRRYGVLMDLIHGKQSIYEMSNEFDQNSSVALDVSSDRKLVVTGLGRKVECWNMKREEVMEIELTESLVSKVALSPCSRFIAVVSDDHRVTIYNFSMKTILMTYIGPIQDLAWSHTQFAIVTVKEIKFWHQNDDFKEVVQKEGEYHCFTFDEEG